MDGKGGEAAGRWAKAWLWVLVVGECVNGEGGGVDDVARRQLVAGRSK